MAGLYGNSDNEIDGEKPHWDDDIDIGDIAIPDHPPETTTKSKKKKKKKKKDGDGVDEGVDVEAMDADVEHPQDDGEWDGTEEMRKKKLDEYMDEIYGLEFNDMV
jgi:protein KRI1